MVWGKGQSGNPGGGPRTKLFTDALRRHVLAPADEKFGLAKAHKRIDVIALQLVKKAMSGDTPAIREIIDRLEGKPAQAITGEDGGTIDVTVRTGASEEVRGLISALTAGRADSRDGAPALGGESKAGTARPAKD